MKVGDYVRTKFGITKIDEIDEYGNIHIDRDYYDEYDELTCVLDEFYIVKSSPNIKSVIEEDDFVNGERVTMVIPEDICGDEILDYQHIFVGNKEIYEEDIKSIVTKEQFEAMKYEL